MAKKVTCGLCRHPGLRVILSLGDQPLSERMDSDAVYPLALTECERCGLVQLGHGVDPDEVFPADHPYTTSGSRELRSHYAALAAWLARGELRHGGLLVDIGANDGTLLREVADRNIAGDVTCVGVEPTDQVFKLIRAGAAGYREFFTTDTAARIKNAHGKATVITASNVLAHVADPHDFADGVRQLLAEGGVFITENHDVASVIRGSQWDTVYHEHRWYWSVATLSRLLDEHGLEVTEAKQLSTHGGSFRLNARIKADLSQLQHQAGESAAALHELLRGLHEEGHEIYGIGATTRAVPLICFSGIAQYLQCVCEVSASEKIGRTLPGTSLPVVDEARLLERKPPYALILSWHMAAGIIDSLRRRGYQGKCIIPLPQPEIIP